jgi:hypothetical protein
MWDNSFTKSAVYPQAMQIHISSHLFSRDPNLVDSWKRADSTPASDEPWALSIRGESHYVASHVDPSPLVIESFGEACAAVTKEECRMKMEYFLYRHIERLATAAQNEPARLNAPNDVYLLRFYAEENMECAPLKDPGGVRVNPRFALYLAALPAGEAVPASTLTGYFEGILPPVIDDYALRIMRVLTAED